MSEYQDHLPTWRHLHAKYDLSGRSLLEYGCGSGTRQLTKLFSRCHSVELWHHEFLSLDWFRNLSEEMSGGKWSGRDVEVCQEILEAERAIRGGRIDTRAFSGPAVDWLRGVIRADVEASRPYFVFVDPGIHMRGEIARIVMEERLARVVVVHDHAWPDDRYGYHLLADIGGWEMTIPVPGGLGTAVFEQRG